MREDDCEDEFISIMTITITTTIIISITITIFIAITITITITTSTITPRAAVLLYAAPLVLLLVLLVDHLQPTSRNHGPEQQRKPSQLFLRRMRHSHWKI
jgi:hypothetical protein